MNEATIRGPWDRVTIERFLEQAVLPIRLAYNGAGGFPVVASHWFLKMDNQIVCAIQRDSYTAKLVRKNPHCGFEISGDQPPYRGVRGQALAHLEKQMGPEILERLIDRYLGEEDNQLASWLRSRSQNETAIYLTPTTLSAWDYRPRMNPR